MHNILTKIIESTRETVEKRKRSVPLAQLKSKIATASPRRNFRQAISEGPKAHIIAEIKRASPSAGLIAPEFDPVKIAKDYTTAGASALSVLTEERHFQGKLDYLTKVRESTTLPLLRKDFFIDTYQVYEAKAYGADAILLIVAVLETARLQGLSALATALGMDCIAEVHSEEDLNRILPLPFEIIGINNRNLSTFTVTMETAEKLASKIPKGRTIIAESGIKTAQDITAFKKLGINAFLIGETLMRSPNLTSTMKRFINA